MKIQPTTLILILLALGLGSFVYFQEFQNSPSQETAQNKQKQLFDFTKDQITSFTIKKNQDSLQFERIQKNVEKNLQLSEWQIKSPINNAANDAYISYLLNLLVDGKIEKSLATPSNRLSEYGLEQPLATVEVKLKNQITHKIILGKHNFDRTLLYAQIDPINQKNSQSEVVLVSPDFEYAVKRPLSDWKAKEPPKKDDSPKKSEKSTPEKLKKD